MAGHSDTRERIIDAAEDVVIRDGVSKLTIEAAAHEAGVSKGGVLYHFPSRADLVTAMVRRFVVGFDADLERFGAHSGTPGDFCRAYLRATISPTTGPGDLRERRIGGALLAGVASDAELLRPLRERFSAWQAAVEGDGIGSDVASIIRLTADGLWLADLFELAPVTGALRDDVHDRLEALIDGASEPRS